MYPIHCGYTFPNYVQTTVNGINLIKLDWSKCEDFKKSKYERLTNQYTPIKKEYIPSIPKEYFDILNESYFKIDGKYNRAIFHYTRNAIVDKSIVYEFGFETMIRDTCLDVVTANLNTALYLLSDCIYDPKKEKFRYDSKAVIHCLLRWCFWSHQIGRAYLKENIPFDSITNNKWETTEFDIKLKNDVTTKFNEWFSKLDECYAKEVTVKDID